VAAQKHPQTHTGAERLQPPAYITDYCRILVVAHYGQIPMTCGSCLCREHNKFGDRSFSAAGPRLWNDLPPGLRRPGLFFDSFRQSLKSYLFGDWSA